MGPPIMPGAGPDSSSLSPPFFPPPAMKEQLQNTGLTIDSVTTCKHGRDSSLRNFFKAVNSIVFHCTFVSHFLSLVFLLVVFRNALHSVYLDLHIVSARQRIWNFVHFFLVHLEGDSETLKAAIVTLQ